MFPFHICLPDSMEGPTPVSALIHSATMVVAGVFLVARLFPIFSIVSENALEVVAVIGGFSTSEGGNGGCYMALLDNQGNVENNKECK